MSFIQRELDRISTVLRDDPQASDYDVLYSAQQALSWATDPAGFKSPLAAIRGIQAVTEDCPSCPCPGQS